MTIRFQRRIILIDRVLQFKYFAVFAGLGGGLTALWGLVIVLIQRQIHAQQPSLPDDTVTSSGALVWYFVVAVIALGVLTGLLGMLITHRIAGPAFVIQRAMAELVNGRYPTLRSLREGDDLKELYREFSALVKSLKEAEAADARKLENALESLSKITSDDARAVTAVLASMHSSKLARLAPSHS